MVTICSVVVRAGGGHTQTGCGGASTPRTLGVSVEHTGRGGARAGRAVTTHIGYVHGGGVTQTAHTLQLFILHPVLLLHYAGERYGVGPDARILDRGGGAALVGIVSLRRMDGSSRAACGN